MTGIPASGKTTLARRLSADLGIALLAKDDIKEPLAEVMPPVDRDASRLLGRATVEVLYGLAEGFLAAGVSVICEANFDRALGSPRLVEILDRTGAEAVQLLLRCPPEVARQRYAARAGSPARHPSHLDQVVLLEWEAGGVPVVEALDLPSETIEVDTSDFARFDYEALLARLRLVLAAGPGAGRLPRT